MIMMKKDVIGTVRVPVAKILFASSEWRKAFEFPEPSHEDWTRIIELRGSVSLACVNGNGRSLGRSSFQEEMEHGQTDLVASTSHCLRLAKMLTFHGFLDARMLEEMRTYHNHGVKTLLVDFGTEDDIEEPAVYWTARLLAESFKSYCDGKFFIGIKMDDDLWATDIACRFGYDYVFTSDSHQRQIVTALRNRMTDGTTKTAPRIISPFYSYCEEYNANDVTLFTPEGCVVYLEDEDKLDKFGELVQTSSTMAGVSIPLVGFYNEEIHRGEMGYEMTEWGRRDGILIDKDVRWNKWTYKKLDEDRLASVCEKIGKLK